MTISNSLFCLINVYITGVCGIQAGWSSPIANIQFQRFQSSPGKNKNTGTFTKLWGFFCILIKAWLKFQGDGEMANISNVRSGHGFLGGRNCGGSAGGDTL